MQDSIAKETKESDTVAQRPLLQRLYKKGAHNVAIEHVRLNAKVRIFFDCYVDGTLETYDCSGATVAAAIERCALLLDNIK